MNANRPAVQLLERLDRWARDRAGDIAFVGPAAGDAAPKTITWAQLSEQVGTLARQVNDRLPGGGAVLVSLENGVEFPAAFLAVIAAGRAVFPVNPDLAPPEKAEAIARSAAGGVIGPDLRIEPLAPATSAPHNPLCDGPALLLSSTGTTGRPKIVSRSAASVDAVCAMMVEAIELAAGDRVLATAPLCHSYGLEHGLLAPVWAGCPVQLCRGLDMAAVAARLSGGEIAILPGVPAMFEMIANIGSLRAPGLKAAYSAGGTLPRGIYERLANGMGIRVGQVYGATEIGSITYGNPRDASFDPASVGRPMRGVEFRLLPTDGADDQIAVRAASMMTGYIDEPHALDDDGFFPTGDLGAIDAAGNLRLTGRLKLLIDIGGLKVSPMEVEAVLAEHESIADCVVVALPLSQTVNRLRAIITPRDPNAGIDLDDVRAFARRRLSPHKVPRVFDVRSALPRSATGKILRQQLAHS